MFDVDLENAESYRESFSYRPGEQAVLADTPWGGYGMGVCYDVRFPALFRDLAGAGAKVLTMPAEMGSRFKFIALTRDYAQPIAGFGLRDDRHRL